MSNYKEFTESPQETLGPNGIEIVREFHGPWADRFDFIAGLPSNYPVTALSSATLAEIKIVPFDPCAEPHNDAVETVINSYDEARITVNYEVNNRDPNSGEGSGGGGTNKARQNTRKEEADGTYKEFQSNGQLEVYTIKGDEGNRCLWEFQGANVPVRNQEGYPIRYSIQDYTIRWGRVAKPDFSLLDSLLGTVNNSSFTLDVADIACPTETLLFSTYGTTIRFSSKSFTDPQSLWEVDLRFLRKNVRGQYRYTAAGDVKEESDGSTKIIGWNHFYRDKPFAGWERVLINGKTAYPLASWSGLYTQISP